MPRFIGCDIHKRQAQFAILDTARAWLQQTRVAATREALTAFAREHFQPGDRLALEATFHTWAVVDLLRPWVEEMDEAFKDIDVLVTPTNGGNQLTITNLTGHPALIVPNGFRSANGTPTSITFLGRLFGEEKVCQVARAWQEKTGFHLKHPDLEAALKSAAAEKAAAGA